MHFLRGKIAGMYNERYTCTRVYRLFLVTLKVNQFPRENMIDASIITSCIVRKYVTEIFIIIRIINIKSVES